MALQRAQSAGLEAGCSEQQAVGLSHGRELARGAWLEEVKIQEDGIGMNTLGPGWEWEAVKTVGLTGWENGNGCVWSECWQMARRSDDSAGRVGSDGV